MTNDLQTMVPIQDIQEKCLASEAYTMVTKKVIPGLFISYALGPDSTINTVKV